MENMLGSVTLNVTNTIPVREPREPPRYVFSHQPRPFLQLVEEQVSFTPLVKIIILSFSYLYLGCSQDINERAICKSSLEIRSRCSKSL